MNRGSEGKWYFTKLRFLTIPFTLFYLLGYGIPLLADHISPPLWFAAVIGIVTWRVTRVSGKIREHFLDYALEHPSLSTTTRDKWKACRESNWQQGNAPPAPAAPFTSDGQLEDYKAALFSLRKLSGDHLDVVLFALVAACASMWEFGEVRGGSLRGTYQMTMIGIVIMSIFGIPAILKMVFSRFSEQLIDAALTALHVFCESPPTVPVGSRAPWSPRSRYGDAENRRAYLIWNLVLVAFLLNSAVVLYPLIGSDVPGEMLGSRYVDAGSMCFFKILHLRYDATTPAWGFGGYFVATFLVTPLFFLAGLVTLVGPTAAAANRLFESNDAIEHERASGGGTPTI